MRSSWRRSVAAAAVLVAAVSVAGVPRGTVRADAAAGPAAAAQEAVVTAAADGPVFTAAGDIDGCNAGEDTAKLVEKTTGPVATIGDNAYPDGSAGDYSQCYDPTWGAFKDLTHPVPGNHDYDVSKATPYYQYFGAAAGVPGSGWYSYDVGSWHIVALNSNCDDVSCSKETSWLDSDLAAHPAPCILAYWHHPRFTSGTSGGNDAVGAFWKVLYAHHATLVLNGHDHDYERFAPQDPSGHADPASGIREFIVGTGGASLGSWAGVAPNSQIRNNGTYGVIELTLGDGAYDWRFVPVAGSKFTDSGSDSCPGTAPAGAPAPATTVPPAGSPPAATTAPPAGSPPAAAQPPAQPEAGGPSDAGGPAPAPVATPAPDDPAGRPAPTSPPDRRPVATSPPPPAAPGDQAAGSGSGRGAPATTSPPATGSTAPSTSPPATGSTAPSTTAPSSPVAGPGSSAPAGDPMGPSADAVGGGAAAGGPAADGAAVADDQALPVAIAGLIHRPDPARSSDRRGLAGVAAVLLAVDTAGLAAYGRRRRAVFR